MINHVLRQGMGRKMWTKDQEELLRTLWRSGVDGSKIAKALGPQFNRNMVAGKAYRLGLPLRGHNGILLSLAAKKGSPKPAAEGTLHGYAEPSECVHSPARVKLVDLLPSSCRWPLGDPKTREFGFCGRNRADGLPYCADHAKVAYQPQQITNRTHGPAREKVSANVTARPKVTV